MHRPTRIKITDLNPHLMCVLCGGYFMDATTIIECLHSFCKSCIVRYLETSKYCPICDVQIHKTKPLLNIRSDQTLQEIVYKLVPGLFQNEMKRRREFYTQHPQQAAKTPTSGYCEERGEVDGCDRYVGDAQDDINFSLEYYDGNTNYTKTNENEKNGNRRYLHCPTAVTVSHLKKLVRAKYELSGEHKVEMMCNGDTLEDDFSLLDISYIYNSRKRTEPLRLCYRICRTASSKRLKTSQTATTSTATSTSVAATATATPTAAATAAATATTTRDQAEHKSETPKQPETKNEPQLRAVAPTTDKLRATENGQTKTKQDETQTETETRETKEKEKPKQTNEQLERKRSAGKLAAIKGIQEKKKVKKRTRGDEIATKNVKRATPDAATSAALVPSAPRENGTRDMLSLKEEAAKKLEAAATLQINGNASSSDVIDARKTSVDKENKQTEEKRDELTNGNSNTDNKGLGLTIGEKVNGLVSEGERENKLELVAAKT